MLSGGQRQRLGVARALLRRTPVLILDEPTAGVDPDGAQALLDDVLAGAVDSAVLLITHRPHEQHRAHEVIALVPQPSVHV